VKYLRPAEPVNGRSGFGYYECSSCKNEFIRRNDSAKIGSGLCKKCSSIENGKKHSTHKASGTRLHKIWIQMKARCYIESSGSYKNYGANGITVCNEWKDSFEEFRDWSILNNYSDSLSIDRINSNGNYSPQNCRWTTKKTQQRNTRRLNSKNTSGYRGVTFSYNKWESKIKVDYKPIYLGRFDTKIEAALVYDNYILTYSLEHTKNFLYNENNRLKENI